MNPAELAQPFAEVLMLDGYLDDYAISRFEETQLSVLEKVADEYGLLDKPYRVLAERALALSKDEGMQTRAWQFDELEFSGNLLTYSTLKTPRLVGHGAIRALCLTFDGAQLPPELEYDDEVLIHVPAFAIQSIDRIAA